MLYLKEANSDDSEKEWQFVAAMPENENGLTNKWHGVSREKFFSEALPEMLNRSRGIDLPAGFVPDTTLFLWNDDKIVTICRKRMFPGILATSLQKSTGAKVSPRKDCV